MEIWKKIPNFSRYEASSEGNLRSINYKNSGKKKVLSPALGKDGYEATMLLSDNGEYKSWKVHKFVALAWIGEKPKGKEINHINGIKSDNRPSNLEYVTHSENCKHSFDVGLQKPKRGELNGMSKHSNELLKNIYKEYLKRKKIYKDGYGRKEIAEMFNVKESLVKDIISPRRYKWIKDEVSI